MAFENASRMMKETGCSAVKLEGGARTAETVRFLVDRGIPVMGHVGLTPQSVNALGGYGTQGIGRDAERVRKGAIALQEDGAFSVVLEKVTVEAAEDITSKLVIPTIGIGASRKCDGQILVTEDLLGSFNRFRPKFVKQYADLEAIVSGAVASYASEVVDRSFPLECNIFRDPTLVKKG